jgi:hypothetical protein
MRTPLTHNQAFNACIAAGTGKLCSAKNIQLIFVAAAAAGHRIEIGLSAAQGSAEVF